MLPVIPANGYKRRGKMIAIAGDTWIADLGGMTCRNIDSRIEVAFNTTSRGMEGRICDMPTELLGM
jgi:hypothetical protein